MGLGHFKRSIALGVFLRKIFLEVILLQVGVEVDCITPIEFRGTLIPDLVIIDIPTDHFQQFLPTYISPQTKLVALDYFGNEKPDLTIAAFDHYPELKYKGNRLVDKNFFIIRNEIKTLKDEVSCDGPALILPGGGDARRLSETMIKYMSAIRMDFLFIQGPLQEMSPNISDEQILKNPPNLPSLMARAPFAITNGGGTMLEMVFLKKPIYVFPQSKMEENLAAYFLQQKQIVGIYRKNELSLKKLSESKNFQGDFIDGNGVENIASAILEHFSL